MHRLTYTFLILFLLSFTLATRAQNLVIEVGAAAGNVVGQKHTLGKGEFHLNLLKSFQFGQLGLDFANGGNFIPGESSRTEGNVETLSPNDSRFGVITALYRLPIGKQFFVEPRLGYASLYYYVHTDDARRIAEPNFTAGIGIGAKLPNMTISLRYQYLGKTANYEGFRDTELVQLKGTPLALILFRFSYRFELDALFGKKK